MLKCCLTECTDDPKYRVTFDTGPKNVYDYCDRHGWRLAKGERAVHFEYINKGGTIAPF